MPRGDKSGNTGVKPHRARRLAEGMMRRGATRAAANQIAAGAMDREYAPKASDKAGKSKQSLDEEASDSRSGQPKTKLTTKKGRAVSGASKPAAARKPSSGKRSVKKTGRTGAAAAGRRPRAASDPATRQPKAKQSTTGTRPPKPRKATGAGRK